MSTTTMSANDAFNEYYKLKNKYESDYNKDKQKIIKNKQMSWKEKRNEYKQLKPKCINCKRPVGTIFSVKHTGEPNDDFRELKAMCGSLSEPCSLNININAGVTYNIMEHIKELEKDIENYKNEIIEYKNHLLFGYTKTETAIENFDRIKEAINDTSFLLNINYEHMFDVVDSKITNESIVKLKEEVYILVNEIKMSIKRFDSTGNVQFIRDSVDIYVNQMESKLKELLTLKYKVNLVEFDDSEGVYRLTQRKNSIADLEDSYIAPSVVNFNYGEIYVGNNNRKQKTTKKPVMKKKLIIETSPLDKENGDDVVITVRPTYNDDGTITWDNAEYQAIWNKLTSKYKQTLLKQSNKEWLLETMNKYVKYKKENKPLEFATPSNLIFPPQILEDGKYDFGNEIYNEIFNKQEKSYQKILLTLYSEKNGVRDYTMLVDTLNNLIKQEVGFNKYV
jgi:hypothetical protein